MEAGADSEVKNDLGLTVLDTISAINTPVTIEISGLIKCEYLEQNKMESGKRLDCSLYRGWHRG